MKACFRSPAEYATNVSGRPGGNGKSSPMYSDQRAVDALGVPGPRGEQVDDQQMNAGVEQLDRLLEERAQGMPAGLVARGDDLDDGNDLIAAAVPDGNTIALAGILLHLGHRSEADLGRFGGQRDAALARCSRSPFRTVAAGTCRLVVDVFQGQDIGPEAAPICSARA